MYKIGDWLRVPKYDRVFQFVGTFTEEGVTYITDGYDDYYGVQGWKFEDTELWSPAIGEWCLFTIEMDEDDFEHPTLMQYGKQPKSIPWLVQPFIGDLPIWCKKEIK